MEGEAMSDDEIARAAEVIFQTPPRHWMSRVAANSIAERLAAAGLLATTPPAPETEKLIRFAIAWRTQPFDSRLRLGQLATAIDRYLAAQPEAQP